MIPRRTPSLTGFFLLAILCAACGSSESVGPETEFPDSNDPDYAAEFDESVDPRISRSEGEADGIVVLFPRVIPADGADAVGSQAEALQARLRAIAERNYDAAKVDVRPAPERVCPKTGCRGMSLGAVLLHHGGGCAAVATIGKPGSGRVRLVPWGGKVKLKLVQIPFRDPPESQIQVEDMMPCAGLVSTLGDDQVIEDALLDESPGSAADVDE